MSLGRTTLGACSTLLIVGVALACTMFSPSQQETEKSGRLEFVKTLKYGSVGTHGSKGWYVSNREFRVNGRGWAPPDFDVNEDIGSCEADPVQEIEALRCSGFANFKEASYVLTMRDDKPVWTVPFLGEHNGKSKGEFADDGRSLVFKDYLFDIATGSKQPVLGAPDYAEDDFRSLSPDRQVIVYQGCCFLKIEGDSDALVELKSKTWAKSQLRENKGTEYLWVIETATGHVDILELRTYQYEWLVWNQDRFHTRREWIEFYRQKLVWQKDDAGRYRPVPIT